MVDDNLEWTSCAGTGMNRPEINRLKIVAAVEQEDMVKSPPDAIPQVTTRFLDIFLQQALLRFGLGPSILGGQDAGGEDDGWDDFHW